jgi:predicted enzyme related to lactoylglutathione lyase
VVSERSEYKPGEFCWVDLSTTDTDAAAEYYTELLGCEAVAAGPVEETGGYGFFMQGDKEIAGYGPVQAEGQPPAWSSYITVTDADATAEKVREAGGAVVAGPMDLPAESGRMAFCQDPEGAFFGAMQQKQHHGAELVNEVGTWTWNQLGTRDLEGAKRFYGSVFGWDATQSELATPEMPYWMWQVEGQRWEEGLAGMIVMGAEMPADAPAHWMVYLAVPDADAAVAMTRERGGSVIAEPQEIPVGRLAVLTDPQEAVVSIIQPNYPDRR